LWDPLFPERVPIFKGCFIPISIEQRGLFHPPNSCVFRKGGFDPTPDRDPERDRAAIQSASVYPIDQYTIPDRERP